MRRLLVTGGAGFIGSHFAEHWLNAHPGTRVIVVDVLARGGNAGNLAALSGREDFRFIQADICDHQLMASLLREEAIDLIVNFAAETHVDRSIADPGPFLHSNVQGVHALLEAARSAWMTKRDPGMSHRFHQVSTDEVFGPGDSEGTPRDETSAYMPTSPYAASKAAADHLVWAWRTTYGLPCSISYSSNVYGPRQHEEKLVPKTISSLLTGRSVPLYGNGRQKRSWIHVGDLCRALDRFLHLDTEGRRLYLGSEVEMTNLEVVGLLCELAGVDSQDAIVLVEDRPGHDFRYGLVSDAFRAMSGDVDALALREGLADTLAWYRARADWDAASRR